MATVAVPVPVGKPTRFADLSPLDNLLFRVGASERPAAARHLLRVAFRKFSNGAPPPSLPADDIGLLAAFVLALPGVTVDDIGEVCGQAWFALVESSAAIQVDNLLRGTQATDMPADVRSCLRAIAGHANKEGLAWPERPTLAGETGVSPERLDKILAELVKANWITKTNRWKPQGGKAPALLEIHPERGRWIWRETAMKRRAKIKPPPPPPRREERQAASPADGSNVPSHGTNQCTVDPTHKYRPTVDRWVPPDGTRSVHLQASKKAPIVEAGAPSRGPTSQGVRTGETGEEEDAPPTSEQRPRTPPWLANAAE